MDPKETSTEYVTKVLISIGYVAIPVSQNVAGQLLIKAKINAVDGLYILDSGAGQTVVDAKQMDLLKLKLNNDEKANTGGGMGVHGIENVPSYNNTLELGEFRYDQLLVAVMSLDSAWESLAQIGAHDTLFGIIGVDVLIGGHAMLDFSTMTLYMKKLS